MILAGIVILFVMFNYFAAIVPNISKKRRNSKAMHTFFAHRGLHDNEGNAPENSLNAFALAVEHGYGIELDVQLTKDKQVIVFHDYDLRRACGINKKICELTYAELCQYSLFSSDEKIPLLKQVLELVNGQVPLLIEIKVKQYAKETCQFTALLLEDYAGSYMIESFSPFALQWFRRHHPEVLRGQLSTNFFKDPSIMNPLVRFILTNMLTNFITRPDFIAYKASHKHKLALRFCKALGCKTAAWTIRTQEQFEANCKDFDMIIFDSFIPKEQQAA